MVKLKGSTKEGSKYINLIPTEAGGFGNMIPILKEYINNKAESVPEIPLGPFSTDTSIFKTHPASGLRITWIGHSSILIEIDGKRILTDPVWSKRVSFTQMMGPKRFFAPPLTLAQLPPLDAILLSHDHYDHLDMDSIKFFADQSVPFYCSIGVGQYLEKWGIKSKITEMDWGDSAMIGDDCQITTTPGRHFSGRGMFNRNETLWSSFVIKGSEHKIFFGADSGPFKELFEEIGQAYGPFDLTMLEVGAYGKNWPDIHMGPDHASEAHLALKGKIMMPIHWGTFNLSVHAWDDPIKLLLDIAKQKNITLFAPKPGVPTEVQGEHISKWWIR